MGDIIIGSGPAGMSAALALIEQGREVTMLDVGEQMEPANAELRARLAGQEPDAWHDDDVASLTGSRQAEVVESIRPFGSDFLFRDPVGLFARGEPPASIGIRPSFATGGLSNGWGASVLPYRDEDLGDWPAGARNLAAHYDAIRQFLPIAGRADALAEIFPALSMVEDTSLPLTSQARRLLNRLDSKRERLNADGVHFGQARVAASAPACRQCGKCLYGCPYGVIFNAAALLGDLAGNPRFSYRPGYEVVRFEEAPGKVTVTARDLEHGEETKLECDRLFVAAGVLPTARLLLNTLEYIDTPVELKDSQHFFLPMLQSWWPTPDPAREAIHTLTQIFVELLDPNVDANTVHAQLYTYNDLFAKDMRQRFGPLAGVATPLIEHLSRRLIVAQGFLHSDVSSSMNLSLVHEGGAARLKLEERRNPEAEAAASRARRKLSATFRSAGLWPLNPLSRLGATGSSFHCGGTFPMRDKPSGLESDVLGRPAGLKRIFVVDASVLPSIPATTITLPVMANAHRIASHSADAVD